LDSELVRLRNNQTTNAVPLKSVGPTLSASLGIRALQVAVQDLRSARTGPTSQPSAPGPRERRSLLKPGASTDPTHLRFGIKVTVAAMICYIIYTALDWPGIHTAFITCCFCALESTGASLRKMSLRIIGCLIGGGLGVISVVYLVPHMESIVSLVLLSAAVTAIAAWVAMGGERIAYAGIQIGFAFHVCLLQNFEPPTKLDAIRDRVVGILLGIVVSALVFRYLWPERAADRLRDSLAVLLRQLAGFVTSPGTENRTALTEQFYSAQQLADQAAFELDFQCPEEVAEKHRLDALLVQAQTHFLNAVAVIPTPDIQGRMEISGRLLSVAARLTKAQPGAHIG
jgi:multidrug resistance protein MdtO